MADLSAWIGANALALVLVLLLDAIFGEPDWLWQRLPHPVVLMGRFIGWQDRRLNQQGKSEMRRWRAGIVMLIRLIFVVAALTVIPLLLLMQVHGGLAFAFQVIIGTVLMAQRSLHDHVAAVATPLATGDLAGARHALSRIVGRETDALDEEGTVRAALESLAENHADGVVAPAFWFLIGGVPGIAIYKAINTADSMVGYKTTRHLAFGWASAKLDDVVNFIPARFSVLLVALGAWGSRFCVPSPGVILRDAPTHASPNAGWPEAAYACALGIALGGPRIYPSQTVDAPFINCDGRKALVASDIKAGLKLFRATCVAMLVLVALIALIAL
ncbi:MAG: adenosylcobinamide-phosphate synthase CbiB [Devosiaceae bacterium]